MTGAAFFDVDGTVVDATIVHYYVFLRTHQMSRFGRFFWMLAFLPRLPLFLLLDRVSRRRFNETFYRLYGGLDAGQTKKMAGRLFECFMKPRLFPAAMERIAEHHNRGHAVVLLSGSLDFLIAPLAAAIAADEWSAARLVESGGLFTGEIEGGALTGERKAVAARSFMQSHKLSRDHCFAYADSLDDCELLECVAHASVVNPKPALRRRAVRSGWEVLRWS